MANFNKIIVGILSIIIGLVLMPVLASFVATTKADTNVSAVAGLTSVMDLILYGVGFGLVFLGVGMIYLGGKGK